MLDNLTFTDNQIKHFRFTAIVSDAIADGLRETFVKKWNEEYGANYGEWDDSELVRQQFAILENKTAVPPPIQEWDCSALFAAILRSRCFGVKDPHNGKVKTLVQLYVPKLQDGTFHMGYVNENRSDVEMEIIAVDQLRLLRNRVFAHSPNTQSIGDSEYRSYVAMVKEGFAVLGIDATKVDQISRMPLESRLTLDDLQKLHTRFKQEQSQYLDENLTFPNNGNDEANGYSISRQRTETLPPISGFLFGRDTLLDIITTQLLSNENVMVSGPPGVGKTKLALHAGYKLKEKGVTVHFATFREFLYEDLVSQEMQQNHSKNKILSAICSTVLDSVGRSKHKTDEAELVLNRWLDMRNGPAILIMDNVENMLTTRIKQHFFRVLSQLSKCEYIQLCFTSREKFQIKDIKLTEYNLPPLDTKESIRLVKQCTGTGRDEETELTNQQAEQLSALCCGLPLAIQIACALVDENKVHADFNQTIKLLEKTNPDRLRHFQSDKWKQESMALEKSIKASYKMLSSTLKKTATELSVFPDDFNANAASDVLGERDVDKCRAFYLLPLMHRNLLGYNEKTTRYSFHPFIREFLVTSPLELEGTFEKAQIRYLESFLQYFQAAAQLYRSGGPDGAKIAMERFFLEKSNIQATFEFMCSKPDTISSDTISQELATKYSHALQFAEFARTCLHPELCQRASRACARLTHRYGIFADALFHYGTEGSYYGYYAKHSKFPEIKRVTDEILKRTEIEKDQGKKALALTSLAMAYAANATSLENILRCLHYAFQALKLCWQTFGEHFATFYAHGIVGGIYGYASVPHKSIEHFREALRIANSLKLGDHPDVTLVLAHMGQTMALFSRNNSDLENALAFVTEAHEILQRLGTVSHADIVRINYEIGNILHKMKNHKDAEKKFGNAIDVGSKLLGDHRLVVWSFKYMARLQRDIGELDQAIGYATAALEMAQRLDNQSAVTADSFVDLAEMYARKGDYEHCFENHLRALLLDPSRHVIYVPENEKSCARRCLDLLKNSLLNFIKKYLVTDFAVAFLVSVAVNCISMLPRNESGKMSMMKVPAREHDNYNEPLYYRLEEFKKFVDRQEYLQNDRNGMVVACKYAADVYRLWKSPKEERNMGRRALTLRSDLDEGELTSDARIWLQTMCIATADDRVELWKFLLQVFLIGIMAFVLLRLFLS